MKVDAAREYAGQVSRKLIYAAVAGGRLKAARVGSGRNLLFCEEWLDSWLQGTASPNDTDERRTR